MIISLVLTPIYAIMNSKFYVLFVAVRGREGVDVQGTLERVIVHMAYIISKDNHIV